MTILPDSQIAVTTEIFFQVLSESTHDALGQLGGTLSGHGAEHS